MNLCIRLIFTQFILISLTARSQGNHDRGLTNRPRPLTPSNPTVMDSVMEDALKQFSDEDLSLQTRLFDEVDKAVPDFTEIKPNILGSGEHGFSVTWITRQSKFINWISAVIKKRQLSLDVASVLDTWLARFRKVYCPYFGPSTCFRTTYRTIDGTCNNLANPLWGRAFTPLIRLLPPDYDFDNETQTVPRNDLPRTKGLTGKPLPSARLVSNIIHTDGGPIKPARMTLEYTAFGQFLAHDFSDTPMESGFSESKLGCCNQTIPTRRCANIPLPQDDVFRRSGRKCFGFVRSTEGTDIDCQLGQREQLNVASSYIDGTGIYGHNEFEARKLRTFKNGQLLMSSGDELSFQSHPNKKAFSHGINFLRAGDEKVSEFTGLVGITTLFYREHNRIASELSQIHPYYDDERLYQEARRIVIAILQQITYKEYLPITLSQPYMDKYSLNLKPSGFYHGYNSNIDPSLSNVFATAAFRFGHSMVTGNYHLLNSQFVSDRSKFLQLKNVFFQPSFFLLNEHKFQRGLFTDPSEQCDRFMAPDLKDHLFETKEGNGLDLAALNIQRARDHGLPSYNAYRRRFGLSEGVQWTIDPTYGFPDLRQETIDELRKVYDDPRDVDVWTGGIAEIPIEGGAVGPLFTEMMALQFRYLRDGDRYWYENPDNGLNLKQLESIRLTSSMARLVCNTADVESIQRKVFEIVTPGGANDRVSCDILPKLNLRLF